MKFFLALALCVTVALAAEVKVCKDLDPVCAEMVKKFGGKCRGQINALCKKSCNNCPEDQQKVAATEPATTKSPMTTLAPTTDATDKPVTTQKTEVCMDLDKNCAEMVKSYGGKCRGRINSVCKKSCNKCSEEQNIVPAIEQDTTKFQTTTFAPTTKPTEKPTQTTEKPATQKKEEIEKCEDYAANCMEIVKKFGGKCRGSINAVCKKSCNNCVKDQQKVAATEPATTKSPMTTLPPTTKPTDKPVTTQKTEVCMDLDKNCAKMVKSYGGKCRGRINAVCKKSCNKCTEDKAEADVTEPATTKLPMTTLPPTTKPTDKPVTTQKTNEESECKDSRDDCAARVKSFGGKCRGPINSVCKKSCGRCADQQKVAATEPATTKSPMTTLAPTTDATDKPVTTQKTEAESECKDYRDDCAAKVKSFGGNCRGPINAVCKKSCGKCAGSDSVPTESQTTNAPMTTLAPITQTTTKPTSTSKAPVCTDQLADCIGLKQKLGGQCIGSVKVLCQKTCELCPEPTRTMAPTTVATTAKPSTESPTTALQTELPTEAATTRDPVVTTGIAGTRAKQENCKDFKYCSYYVRKYGCSERTKKYCKLSCNSCGDSRLETQPTRTMSPITSEPTTDVVRPRLENAKCKDYGKNCHGFVKRFGCNGRFTALACKKSCNQCSGSAEAKTYAESGSKNSSGQRYDKSKKNKHASNASGSKADKRTKKYKKGGKSRDRS